MRVLHYYPKDDAIISAYVTALCDSMGLECTNERATEPADALQRLRERPFDLLHLHGCWRNSSYRIVQQAFKIGARLILSPHGQLEPWVQKQDYWKEKLPKQLMYQRHIVARAYVIIIQGKMEEECISQTGWNKRMQIIRNPLITQTTTAKEMAQQTYRLYRKVMDSNTWELLDDDNRSALRMLIKAGITGDERWIKERNEVTQWRELLCYAHQQQIEDIIQRGIRVMQVNAPDMDVSNVPCFMPDHYQPAQSIESAIGISFATENARLMATFRHLRKLIFRNRLTISHLVELDRELRYHGCDEELLGETLQESHLYKMAGRVMWLMSELTGLTEGFMPVPPCCDWRARKLRKQVENNLKLS